MCDSHGPGKHNRPPALSSRSGKTQVIPGVPISPVNSTLLKKYPPFVRDLNLFFGKEFGRVQGGRRTQCPLAWYICSLCTPPAPKTSQMPLETRARAFPFTLNGGERFYLSSTCGAQEMTDIAPVRSTFLHISATSQQKYCGLGCQNLGQESFSCPRSSSTTGIVSPIVVGANNVTKFDWGGGGGISTATSQSTPLPPPVLIWRVLHFCSLTLPKT